MYFSSFSFGHRQPFPTLQSDLVEGKAFFDLLLYQRCAKGADFPRFTLTANSFFLQGGKAMLPYRLTVSKRTLRPYFFLFLGQSNSSRVNWKGFSLIVNLRGWSRAPTRYLKLLIPFYRTESRNVPWLRKHLLIFLPKTVSLCQPCPESLSRIPCNILPALCHLWGNV